MDNFPIVYGAPTKYDPKMCETIVDIASKGGHIAQMMVAIGVRSKDTWYRWKAEYPEFNEAVEFAEIVSLAFYENVNLLGTMGQIKNFNATSMAMILNNKFRTEYTRSGSGGTEITVHNNTLNLSDTEKLTKITQKLEKLKSLGVDIDGQVTRTG